jgi:hypothetical protein
MDEKRINIGLLVDVIIFDLGQPLRKSLSNLANVLLNRRMQRVQALFDDLLGPPVDHGLMVNSVELTRRSRPVISLQQLCNRIHRESRPNVDEVAQAAPKPDPCARLHSVGRRHPVCSH